MKQISLISMLFIVALHSFAQKTITDKDYRGRITKQYQINSQGNRHGYYKEFFNNGIPEREDIFVNGKQISSKNYMYWGATRYLMSSVTWDTKGKTLIQWHRNQNYTTGKMSELVQIKGQLTNGKGSWEYAPPSDSEYYPEYYTEKYKGNDTLYRWSNKTKERLQGKFVNGERILSKAENAEKLAKKAEAEAKDNAKALEDSIATANRETEYRKVQQKNKDWLDVRQKQKDSITAVEKFQFRTDSLYTELIIKHYARNEGVFYEKLLKYLENKKNADAPLQNLIANTFGIKFNDLSKYFFDIDSTWDGSGKREYGIWIYSKSNGKEYKRFLCCGKSNRNAKVHLVHDQQLGLIEIINYALNNNITL